MPKPKPLAKPKAKPRQTAQDRLRRNKSGRTAQEPTGRKKVEPEPKLSVTVAPPNPAQTDLVPVLLGQGVGPGGEGPLVRVGPPLPHVHSQATPNRCCPDEPKEQVIQRLRENEPKWEPHPKDAQRSRTGEPKAKWSQRWAAWRLTLDQEEAR
jgi:hypothetical protein